jgi:hypothetical protein
LRPPLTPYWPGRFAARRRVPEAGDSRPILPEFLDQYRARARLNVL